jgi:predicted amidohydrolase YtcJ
MCIACKPALLGFMRSAINRRTFVEGMAILAAGTVVETATAGKAFASGPEADTIFHGGRIYTMNAAEPVAQAIAIKAGKIQAVGTSQSVMRYRGEGTKVVDIGTQTLLPGFVDPHMHYIYSFFDSALNLGPFVNTSMDEVKAKLQTAVAAAKPGEWIVGQLFDPLIVPGTFDTSLAGLDAIAPANPLFILEDNGHVGFVNSKAFDAAKITAATPNPPQGRYVRNAAGQLTGELNEAPAMQAFVPLLPVVTPAQYVQNVLNLFSTAASVGCTTLHDMGVGLLNPQLDYDTIKAAFKADPPVRMTAFLSSAAYATWQKLGITPNQGDDRLRFTGIKCWVDGTNQGKTAFQREPYLNSSSKGNANYTAAELLAAVEQANDAGWQVAIHCNGDAGIDMGLDAYQAALQKTPRADARHRIDHSTVCHLDQLRRMKALGVSPSFTIGHVYYWGAPFQSLIFGSSRANLIDPCKSALDSGLRISLHSDYNTTPIGPLVYVHNAVTRLMRGTNDVLNAEERIAVDQALRAVTIDAAWQCHSDGIVGSLETGKYADLVLLAQDPHTVRPEEIINIQVNETWLAGSRRFQKT